MDRKNIVFDFGNVLVQWHPELVFGEYFGDEAKAWWFLSHVADSEWRLRIDAGESYDGCVGELQVRFPEFSEAIELYHTRWLDMLTGEMPGMRQLLNDLKEYGYELFGLTNWSMETFPIAREHFPILQMIDRYVVSGAEGYVKPDQRLFQVLLDRYNLKAEDCVFVDDNPDNVAAANCMGMRGILFICADNLRKKLNL